MSAKADYGFGARLLHHFALAPQMVQEMSFQIDQMLRPSRPEEAREGEHVFVSALARAGTTALMRLLYETGEFRSLTYRDMPFPLAPRLWKKLSASSAKEGDLSERAHGDGIQVHFDSPEALEEVFWRVFSGKRYILPDRLVPMEASPETIEAFRKYIAALLEMDGAKRYLSKNNNNILRLSSLLKAFPEAVVIIPFRDPLQHSLSLLRQHTRFVQVHKEDSFSRKYMDWLVHHEFGSGHRRFDLDGSVPSYRAESPDYWLEQWNRVYTYLVDRARSVGAAGATHSAGSAGAGGGKILFLEYEALCDRPEAVWKKLARGIGVKEELPAGFSLAKAPERDASGFDKQLEREAYGTHKKLREISGDRDEADGKRY
ncbi:MAG: sulfotransferase [Spirochaetaceae bacterium]